MTEEQQYDRREFVKNALMGHIRTEYKWETRDKENLTIDDFVAYLLKTGKRFGIDTEIAMKPTDKPSHPLFSYPMVLEQHIISCLIYNR